MAPQTPQPGMIESKSSQMTGASSIAPLAETHLQRWHQLIHRNTAIAATENMAQDAYYTMYLQPDSATIDSTMQSDMSSSIWV